MNTSFDSSKVFKILSIDGGGVKGTYSAFLLKQLEDQLAKPSRHRLAEYFDLICGTSTGAIMALALAAGKDCTEIATFYEKECPRIFYDHHWLRRLQLGFKQVLCSSRYDNKTLKSCISRLIGDKRISQSSNYLCISVTNLDNYSARVYKTRHSNKHSWTDSPMADIALASSAAPTFFPIVPSPAVQGSFYADGGLVANNPTVIGIIEAMRVFVGNTSERNEYDSFEVLSVGSYDAAKNHLDGSSPNKSALQWMLPQDEPPLLTAFMSAQTSLTNKTVEIIKEFVPQFTSYCRIDAIKVKCASTPPCHLCSFSLSDARPQTIAKLKQYGTSDGLSAASDPIVKDFFANTIKPITLMMEV